jgi:hypothetical protein
VRDRLAVKVKWLLPAPGQFITTALKILVGKEDASGAQVQRTIKAALPGRSTVLLKLGFLCLFFLFWAQRSFELPLFCSFQQNNTHLALKYTLCQDKRRQFKRRPNLVEVSMRMYIHLTIFLFFRSSLDWNSRQKSLRFANSPWFSTEVSNGPGLIDRIDSFRWRRRDFYSFSNRGIL